MGLKKVLLNGGKIAAYQLAPDVLNLAAKVGVGIVEKQKSLVKIPDLKDVNILEALRVLNDELNLIPVPAVANPRLAYADDTENHVMYTKPRAGSRVNPRTTVRVYFLTQEVINRSKLLLQNAVKEFDAPRVVGLNIYEAREEFKELELTINEKIEKPSSRFANYDNGQVTRATYPNGKRVGSKIKTNARIRLYYVSREVIVASKAIKEKKDKDKQEKIEKILKHLKIYKQEK